MDTFLKCVLPSFCTIVVALISSFMVIRSSKKENRHKEAEKIKKYLQSFYYPFYIRCKQNLILREAFGKNYDENYRILIDLLNGKNYKGNDKVLLEKIIENDRILNDLILGNQNIVSNNVLRENLAKLSAHYTMFLLACDGKIQGECDRFSAYVHPTDVVKYVEEEILRLEKKIVELTDGNCA